MMIWRYGTMVSPWGGIVSLLFLVALAFLVGLLVWSIARAAGSSHGATSDRALEIVRERFARGEINQAEFEATTKTLAR